MNSVCLKLSEETIKEPMARGPMVPGPFLDCRKGENDIPQRSVEREVGAEKNMVVNPF